MDRSDAQSICICPECPTYVGCDEPVAFCLREQGTSECISKERGCLCGGCPVHEQLAFQYGYYCTRGSEATQSAP